MRVLRSQGAEAVPSWMPPAITEALSSVPFVSVDWVQIVSDLGPGDAITTWMADNEHRERPTMLLMSSRGHTGLRRFLEGSVSGYLVEQSQTPCLIVRSQLQSEGGQAAAEAAEGRTIGIAIDGSSAGRALVEFSRTFLLRPTDRVTVLHSRPAGQKVRALPRRVCCTAGCGPHGSPRRRPGADCLHCLCRRTTSWQPLIALSMRCRR